MIVAHLPDVNPDDYCFETTLDFSKEFGAKLLNEAHVNFSQFTQRFKYNRGNTYKELVKLVGVDNARELNRRKLQFEQFNPGQKPIKFLQWFLPEELDKEFYTSIPSWVFEMSEGEPKSTLQTSAEGEYLPTHMGHKRQSSLFMLLAGQEQETRWYRPTSAFEYIDPYRIPDHDKIEHVVTAVMEPFKWYAFNHLAWHSVHKFSEGSMRINMGLDFDNLTMENLVKELKARQ
tara:strand:+ start:2448 stop:3143 length:696 start_codon:yes stop_codon:yes gene_type:complete